MNRVALLATLAAGLVALPAATRDPLAGRVAGKQTTCLTSADADHLFILDEHTLAAQRTDRRLWIVHPIGACPTLRVEQTLILERFGGQICRNDRFRVLDQGTSIPSAYCRLGAFTPYDKVPTARR